MAEVVTVQKKTGWESKIAWLGGFLGIFGLGGVLQTINFPVIAEMLNYIAGSGVLPTGTAAIITTIAGVLVQLSRLKMPDIKKK